MTARPSVSRGEGGLAILGGRPRFPEPLHVGRPNIGDRDRLFARLDRMLDTRWLSNGGPLVLEFEERIRQLTGARHALAVANATIGLELAARAAGLTGEVIVPAFTFVATPHALRWVGLRPVFADIDPVTFTIDVADAERRITEHTSGIVGVHVYGRACDTDGLAALASRHGLRLLYDAAHALGCSRDGRPIGGFGDAEVFSFHATKFVNAFEGGAITTDDDELAERLELMRNFGFSGYDATASEGTNGKMHEATAAMGLTSLDALPELVAVNRAHAARYAEGLAGVPGIRQVRHDLAGADNAQYVIIRVDAAESGLTRDQLQAVLVADNVLARRYFWPGCHRLEPYASESPSRSLPVTERIAAEVLSLPTGTAVSAEDVDGVVELIRAAVAHAPLVRHRLGERA
jgi:dTDP-4-amino-4,6-dideoxyglucose